MLTAVKGYYEGGKIILEEEPAVTSKTEVIVTFLPVEDNNRSKARIPGALKGKILLSDDFDDPLDDLKDCM